MNSITKQNLTSDPVLRELSVKFYLQEVTDTTYSTLDEIRRLADVNENDPVPANRRKKLFMLNFEGVVSTHLIITTCKGPQFQFFLNLSKHSREAENSVERFNIAMHYSDHLQLEYHLDKKRKTLTFFFCPSDEDIKDQEAIREKIKKLWKL